MPSSTYYSILQAVQTQVQTIVPNAVLRRQLILLESDIATLPMVLIVPDLPGGEKIVGNNFKGANGSGSVWYYYPVLLAYVQAGAPDMITGLDTFLSVRQNMKQLLYQPLLSGVAEVFDMDLDPDATHKFTEFVGSNYDVAGWRLNYKACETRSG